MTPWQVDFLLKIHVPLPSAAGIETLLPALCHKNEPRLDLPQVCWAGIAQIADGKLSVRGLQEIVGSMARKKFTDSTTTEDVVSIVVDKLGHMEPEPLRRAYLYVRVENNSEVSIETCLARCGWDFAADPTLVYYQAASLDEIPKDALDRVILLKVATNELFTGVGCFGYVQRVDPEFLNAEYKIFVQCGAADKTRPVPTGQDAMLFCQGARNARHLGWQAETQFVMYAASTAPRSLHACLAPHIKPFTPGHVFIEVPHDETLGGIDASELLLVKLTHQNRTETCSGSSAKLIAGDSTASELRALGYDAFIVATSPEQIVPAMNRFAYRNTGAIYDDLTQHHDLSGRFVKHEHATSTVGATLRANDVYYAELDAVYIPQTRMDNFRALVEAGNRVLAVDKADPTVILTGARVATLAEEVTFRHVFQVFVSATSAADSCEGLLLDMENLTPTIGTGPNVAIIACFQSHGRILNHAQNRISVSDTGAQCQDVGYDDNTYLHGFRRGWYGGLYWRMVGGPEPLYLSAGVGNDSYKFRIYENHDFGVSPLRAMVKLPHVGIVFCRGIARLENGVAVDDVNPELACVVFDESTSTILDTHAFQGQLGRWNDLVL